MEFAEEIFAFDLILIVITALLGPILGDSGLKISFGVMMIINGIYMIKHKDEIKKYYDNKYSDEPEIAKFYNVWGKIVIFIILAVGISMIIIAIMQLL